MPSLPSVPPVLGAKATQLVTQKAIAGLLRQERHAMPLAEVCQGAGCWRQEIFHQHQLWHWELHTGVDWELGWGLRWRR